MQADDLAMIVFNACLFVAAAVSGMRSSELMELTARSCLPPRQSGQGLFRYSLASKRIKGEPLGGAADEWVVIEPAYRAVELATRLSGAKTALAGMGPGTSVFGRYAFTTRFNTFRRWVNSAAGTRLGLSPIPEEQVTARMVRRTLALELARRPHGLLAAKVHLKHISIATTEGYAARPGGSQARFNAEREAEERKQNEKRAIAAYRDFQDGVLPAGPGARSLIAAFHYVDAELAGLEARQPTVVATDRHIELLLQKRVLCGTERADEGGVEESEFEQRLGRMQAEGQLPDPRAAQIIRLKDDNAKLRQRMTEREQEIAGLSAFKTTALSRLAAQHQEITALRAALSSRASVRTLPGAVKPQTIGSDAGHTPAVACETLRASRGGGRPRRPGGRSAVSGLFISTHRTVIRWMAWRTMVSGSALCPAWLSPSVTTPSA
jgi:hypothetical protein